MTALRLTDYNKPVRVFVAHSDGTFQCEACARSSGVDLADDDTDVWEVGSRGWLGPVVCRTCKLSIPVYVDGEEAERP